MPKKGGKKKGKRVIAAAGEAQKRAIVYKGDMEEYAQVSRMLGDRRILAMMPDKSEILAIIPGRFRKRCWFKVGDVIIVSYREFEQSKLDVIHKYNDDETRKLAKELEIPDFFLEASMTNTVDDDDGVLFEDSAEEDIDVPKQKSSSYADIIDNL